EGGLGLPAAVLAEVAAVVVGGGEEIEARLVEPARVAGGRAEGVAGGAVGAALVGGAAVAQRTLEVAEGEIGVAEQVGHGREEAGAVVGGELGRLEAAAEHDVADGPQAQGAALRGRRLDGGGGGLGGVADRRELGGGLAGLAEPAVDLGVGG